MSDVSGSVSAGRPRGMSPKVSTPYASSPSSAVAATPAPMATSGAGTRGTNVFTPTSSPIVPRPTASVLTDVSGRCWNKATRFSRNEPLGKCSPSSFGI